MYYLHQQVASRIKFLDESGFNTRESSLVYGHSERGLSAVEVLWHAKVTKSRETRFHSRKLGFTPDKLGLSRVN